MDVGMKEQALVPCVKDHGENGRQFVMILGADLGEHLPLRLREHLDEEKPGTSHGLANGLGLPGLVGFDVQDVVPELVLPQRARIRPEVLVDEPHGPVVGVACTQRVMPQGQQIGVAAHGVVGMDVIQRIAVAPVGACGDGGCCG